jgi:hypothetical protein
MAAGSSSINVQIDGKMYSRSKNFTADNPNHYGDASTPITIPAGTACVAASFVNDADGTASATLPAGHGLATGTYDVYWDGGMRYGVTGTIAVNALDLDNSGDGDDWPVSTTDIIISEQATQVNIALDGDAAEQFACISTVRGQLSLYDASDNLIASLALSASEPYAWDSDQATNPFTGDPITYAYVTNGTTAAGSFRASVLQDSTPE